MKAKLLMIGGCMAIAVIGWLLLPLSQVRADLEPDCAANPLVVQKTFHSLKMRIQ
jgi:hypothetical protein